MQLYTILRIRHPAKILSTPPKPALVRHHRPPSGAWGGAVSAPDTTNYTSPLVTHVQKCVPVCTQEVLGGSEADTVGAGGDSSFQSSGSNSSGGGPAAATPAGVGAPAAAAAVQRASDAVKQLQQSTANLGRRLLRA